MNMFAEYYRVSVMSKIKLNVRPPSNVDSCCIHSLQGMYLPGMAHYIFQQNMQAVTPHVNLQGIALGNGWADVLDQGGMLIDYAWWYELIVLFAPSRHGSPHIVRYSSPHGMHNYFAGTA